LKNQYIDAAQQLSCGEITGEMKMGLLQKVFDKSSAVGEKIFDAAERSSSRPFQVAAAAAFLPVGVTLEATALAAKVVAKKPLDTTKTSISGLFF
jgi:hypothetical protein